MLGAALVVQWLRLWTSTTGLVSSIPGQGMKILPLKKVNKEKIDKIISDIDKKHKEINQGDVQVSDRATSTVRTS